MDLNIILPAAVALNTLISCATAVYALLTAGSKKTAAELEAFRARVAEREAQLASSLAGLDRRMQGLEADIRHLPSREATHKLEMAVTDLAAVTKTLDARLSGRMDALDERLKPVAATSARLQEYLLRQASGK